MCVRERVSYYSYTIYNVFFRLKYSSYLYATWDTPRVFVQIIHSLFFIILRIYYTNASTLLVYLMCVMVRLLNINTKYMILQCRVVRFYTTLLSLLKFNTHYVTIILSEKLVNATAKHCIKVIGLQ